MATAIIRLNPTRSVSPSSPITNDFAQPQLQLQLQLLHTLPSILDSRYDILYFISDRQK